MADVKISLLPSATGLTTDDLIPICNDPGGSPATQKLTGTQLATFINAQVTGITTSQISDDQITDGKLRNSSALSVIGRSANSTGDPADIAASSDGDVLRRSGTTLGFGTIATAGITDGAVTTAKLADDACTSDKLGLAAIEDVASTSYTLVAADLGKIKRFTSGSAVTVTVPNTLSTGFHCMLSQNGAGQVTVQGDGTLTLRNYGTQLKLAGQYAVASVVVVASNEGRLYGQVTA